MSTRPADARTRHRDAHALGYPAHRVTDHTQTTHDNGITVITYTTACGHTSERTHDGIGPPWVDLLKLRAAELCQQGCWA